MATPAINKSTAAATAAIISVFLPDLVSLVALLFNNLLPATSKRVLQP